MHTHTIPTSVVLFVNNDIPTPTFVHLVSPHTSHVLILVFSISSKSTCTILVCLCLLIHQTRFAFLFYRMVSAPVLLKPNIQQHFIYGEGLRFKMRFREN